MFFLIVIFSFSQLESNNSFSFFVLFNLNQIILSHRYLLKGYSGGWGGAMYLSCAHNAKLESCIIITSGPLGQVVMGVGWNLGGLSSKEKSNNK